MRYKGMIFVLIFAAFLFGGCGCKDKNRYYNDKKGFSLVIPPDWSQVKPLMGGDLAIVPPGTGEMGEYPALFTVVVRENRALPTMAGYMTENIGKIRSVLAGFRMISSGEERIDDRQAGMIHFTFNQGTDMLKMEVIQYILLYREKDVSLTYTALSSGFSRYTDDIKKIAMSFRSED